MDLQQNPNPAKPDRKTAEKNRRCQMKELYSTLTSLLPSHPSREVVSVQAQLEGATDYIKNLEAKLENLKEKKRRLIKNSSSKDNRVPGIEVGVMGSGSLHVALVTGLNCRFVFGEAIRVLHEEGAHVVTATFSVTDATVFHNIHFKIGNEWELHGVAARISERLRKLLLLI